MNTAGKTRILAAIPMAATMAASAADSTVRFTGEARSLEGGELLYTEHHEQIGSCDGMNWIPESNEVVYRNPDGKTIAEKTVDYTEAPERPGFILEDKRFNERMEVRNRDDREATVKWRTTDGDRERYEADIPDNGVIDAGFEVMVRNHWNTLVDNGDGVSIRFFAPTRGKFYGFEAEPADKAEIEADHVFQIRASGWVSSWFVDNLYLGYNDERQLTDFYGLTNILKNPDDNHVAHIHYTYEQAPDCG